MASTHSQKYVSETQRPALPFLLLPVAFVWLGLILAHEICFDNFAEKNSTFIVILIVAIFLTLTTLIVFFFLKNKVSPSELIAILLGFIVGLIIGFMYWSTLPEDMDALEKDLQDNPECTLQIIEDPNLGEDRQFSNARLLIDDNKEHYVMVFWRNLEEVQDYGRELKCKVSFSKLKREDKFRSQFQKHIEGSVNITQLQSEMWQPSALGAIANYRSNIIAKINNLSTNTQMHDGAQLVQGILL